MNINTLRSCVLNFGSLATDLSSVAEVTLAFPSFGTFSFDRESSTVVLHTGAVPALRPWPVAVDGVLLGNLYVPRELSSAERGILEKLLKSFETELKLHRATEKVESLTTILDSLDEAIIACDEAGSLSYFNRKSLEPHGLVEAPLSPDGWAEHYDLFHADGKTRMQMQDVPLFRTLQGEQVVNTEMVIAREGQEKLHFFVTGTLLLDKEGRKSGALVSMREETQLKKELERVESRFRAIFQQSPLSIQICRPDGRTVLVNPAWKKLWSIPEEVIENYILKDYNMLADETLEAQGVMGYIRRGYSGEITHVPVIKYDTKEAGLMGRTRLVEGLIYPLKDSAGAVTEIVLIHNDVTERIELDRMQVFLANVSSILMSSLDYDKTIQLLAEASVPEIAEGCIIDLIEDKRINRLVTRHEDPATQALLVGLQVKYPPSLGSPQPSARVIRSGEPELLSVVDQETILSRCLNETHAELISQIGIKSHIAVPLMVRGKIIGAINLMNTSGKVHFDEVQLRCAVEFARLASLAIENTQLYRESQQATELRDEFISIASHELKTPITSMKLQFHLAEKILAKETPELSDLSYFRKMTKMSVKQLSRITLLVEDMLDVSRISSGKLEMKTQECDLSGLVFDVIEQLSFEIENLRDLLVTEVPAGLRVRCDAFRIEQVLTNLITNAIRYGDKKPVTVSLTQDGAETLIKVRDQGPGVAAADQERIFEKFERATTINISGLGMGLYISREIMNLHNGFLRLVSEKGQGATFIAGLPLAR